MAAQFGYVYRVCKVKGELPGYAGPNEAKLAALELTRADGVQRHWAWCPICAQFHTAQLELIEEYPDQEPQRRVELPIKV